jgi:Protein of unknown function (DUF3006)
MSTDHETWVVDRFERDVAVLVSDDERTAQVLRSELPEGMRPGVVLRVPRGGGAALLWSKAVVDEEATSERLEESGRILGELKKRDPGGDVAL